MSGLYVRYRGGIINAGGGGGGGGGAGTVTQVNTGAGLTGGPITTTGTIAVASVSLTNQVVGLLPIANGGSTGSNTGDVSVSAVGSSPNANGALISAGQVLTLQPSSASQPGIIGVGVQTIPGPKTFQDTTTITGSATTMLFLNTTASAGQVNALVVDSSGNTAISLRNINDQQGMALAAEGGPTGNWGIAVTSTGSFRLSTGGQSRMLIDTSGNISITASSSITLSSISASAITSPNFVSSKQMTIGSVTQTSSTGGAAYTVKWPGAQGSSAQVLTNDSAGNLYWSTPAAGGGSALSAPTVFVISTSTGTYNVSSGTTLLKITAVGGGGGGGGVAQGGAAGSSGGGGGAGTSIKWFSAASISANSSTTALITITVAAGGKGGLAGSTTGSTGATTTVIVGSVSQTISALGGVGGAGTGGNQSGPIINAAASNGGVPTGGDINITGGLSALGFVLAAGQAVGASGGASVLGGGGNGGNNNIGLSGGAYGGGGGGASNTSNGVARAGGDGGQGIVIIEAFFQ